MNKREKQQLDKLSKLTKEQILSDIERDTVKLQAVLDNIKEFKKLAANLKITKEDCDNATDKYLKHQEYGDLISQCTLMRERIRIRIDRSKKYLGI